MKVGQTVRINGQALTVLEWDGNGYLETIKEGFFSQVHYRDILSLRVLNDDMPKMNVKLYNHCVSYPKNFNRELHMTRHFKFWLNNPLHLYDFLYPSMDMNQLHRFIIKMGDRTDNYAPTFDNALWAFCEKTYRRNWIPKLIEVLK